MKFKIIAFICCWFFCSSCDCLQTAKGTVVSFKTKLALANVKITNLKSSNEITFTKFDGEFDISEIASGLKKCPSIDLEFSKDGYLTDTVIFENEPNSKIIYLKEKI